MKRRAVLSLGMLPCLPTVMGASLLSAPPGRFALVIGNGAYHASLLPNTRPDSELIAGALASAGFAVTLRKDLNRSEMFDAVRRFSESVSAGGTALVYYAGHGLQIQGKNYLLPVDTTPTSEAGVALRAFPLQALHERLALSRSAVNIIILDACRNNPFRPIPAVRMRNYANLGLANPSAPRGTLVAYSTAPGQLAEDGTGRKHSLYTETLAALLGRRGLTAENLFRTLSDEVRRRTLEEQQPWFESSLAGDFYFRLPPGWRAPPPGTIVPVAPPRLTKQYRGSIGSSGDASWYRDMDERAWTELDQDIEGRARHVDTAAMARLRRQAGAGNVVAMTTLALAALAKVNKRAAAPEAVPWLRKAARLGFPVAQTVLAELIAEGRAAGVKAEAVSLLESAAQARYPRARINLAQLQFQREQNPEAAQRLLDTIWESTRATTQQYRAPAR